MLIFQDLSSPASKVRSEIFEPNTLALKSAHVQILLQFVPVFYATPV